MDLLGIIAAHKFWIGLIIGLFIGANIGFFTIGLLTDGKNREQKIKEALIRREYGNLN